MLGIYALPEPWKQKLEEEQAMYSYEVNLLGESLQEGKVIPKELSEEEKAEAEAAKGGKGAKAPPPPKGKKEDEGPRPGSDEAERLERER